MGNFQGGNNRGGGFRNGDRGGRSNFGGNRGGGDRGPATMHKAVCDECHKSCEVPFRPSQDKPIYCNDCFSTKRDDGNRAPRRDFSDRGHKMEFNNKPSSFSKPQSNQDDIKKQLNEINVKIDRLFSVVEKIVSNNLESKVVLPKKIDTKKVVAVKKVIPTKNATKKIAVKKVTGKKK